MSGASSRQSVSPHDHVAITPLGYDLGSVAVKMAAFVPGLVPVVKNRTV